MKVAYLLTKGKDIAALATTQAQIVDLCAGDKGEFVGTVDGGDNQCTHGPV